MAALYELIEQAITAALFMLVGFAALVWTLCLAFAVLAIFTAPIWIVGLVIWLAVR